MTTVPINTREKLKMYFVTSSQNKFDRLNSISELPIHFLKMELEEIQGTEKEIVYHKMKQAKRFLSPDCAILVDDSSINMEGQSVQSV